MPTVVGTKIIYHKLLYIILENLTLWEPIVQHHSKNGPKECPEFIRFQVFKCSVSDPNCTAEIFCFSFAVVQRQVVVENVHRLPNRRKFMSLTWQETLLKTTSRRYSDFSDRSVKWICRRIEQSLGSGPDLLTSILKSGKWLKKQERRWTEVSHKTLYLNQRVLPIPFLCNL